MKKDRQFLIGLGLILIFFIFWGLHPINAGTLKTREKITCEDGEEFLVEETEVLKTLIPPAPDGEFITVDTRTLRLTLYQEWKVVKSYPVAIGTMSTPTPVGEWKIIHKGGNWGDGFGLRWMGLNVPWGIYGIHGTNKPNSIGSRASHGCVRMFNRHVLELYNLTKMGTPVYILGELPKVSLRREITRKSTGRDVLIIQYSLRKSGFDPGPADARFGPDMQKAVLQLQYLYGLAPTGKVSLNEQYLLGLRKI